MPNHAAWPKLAMPPGPIMKCSAAANSTATAASVSTVSRYGPAHQGAATATSNAASPAQRSDTLCTFAAIIARYYRAGISHGDMKANNFIVTDAGVTIIDLDPMRAHRRRAALEKALRRDIERFLQNFEGPLRAQLAGVLLPLLPAPLQRGPSRH